MNPFLKMMERIQSSNHYDRVVQFTKPLYDNFGINHFWYYRISSSGTYSYVGTNASWNEYSFGHSLFMHFPCLRHPTALRRGITLMKAGSNTKYEEVLKTGWEKFRINFHLNILENCPEGVEAFGFGSRFNDPEAEERLLNELSLLRYFIKEFRQKHMKLFSLLEESSIDLSSSMGAIFHERPRGIVLPFERSLFLRQLGCSSFFELTPKEKSILKLLASGFPASYSRLN